MTPFTTTRRRHRNALTVSPKEHDWQSYFKIDNWLPRSNTVRTLSEPTSYTREGNVEDWVFLGEEADPSQFTYADVAAGMLKQVNDEAAKDYVWLSSKECSTLSR